MDRRFDANHDSSGKFSSGNGGSGASALAGGKHGLLSTPAVHAHMNELYKASANSFMDRHDHTEHSFTVDGLGKPRPIVGSKQADKDTVVVHPADTAIVHTHPLEDDKKPSAADEKIANTYGEPNYVLSAHELWVAPGDGTASYKVGDVEWKDGDLVITPVAIAARYLPTAYTFYTYGSDGSVVEHRRNQ